VVKLREKLQLLAQFSAKEKLYVLLNAVFGRLLTLSNRLLAKIPADHQQTKSFFTKLRAAGYEIKKIRDTNVVTIRGDIDLGDYRFLVRRRTSDVQAAQLVLMEKEYRPLIDLIFRYCQQESIEYVVDAGANVGYATIFLKKIFSRATCLSIEPDAGNYRLLVENVRINHLENVLPLQAALWTSGKTLTTNRTFRDGMDWSISVAEANNDCNTIKGITIAKLMEDHLLPRLDVLKMDIEGAEALIFCRDAHPEQFLCKVRFVALEIHGETKSREEILNTLRGSEFAMSFHGETVFGVNRKCC